MNNAYCRFAFSPYGLLTDPDSRLLSANLQVQGSASSPLEADFEDSDYQGFWVATFDELPDSSVTTYQLNIEGNADTDSVPGLTFLSSLC